MRLCRYHGEMPELAEGARLEIVCAGRLVPRVRIPLSPPCSLLDKEHGGISPSDEVGEADPLALFRAKIMATSQRSRDFFRGSARKFAGTLYLQLLIEQYSILFVAHSGGLLAVPGSH